jgi:hypothetical protein
MQLLSMYDKAPTTLVRSNSVKRPRRSPPHVVVRSIAFTPNALDELETLAAGIAARTGRKASVSAVVRALLRNAQEVPNILERLGTLVEHERAREVVWGKPPRDR